MDDSTITPTPTFWGCKMKVKDILKSDMNYDSGNQIIQKALRKVKPFAKYPLDENIEMENLEKAILIYCSKYNLSLSFNYFNKVNRYHGYIHSEKDQKVINAVYSNNSIYELYCKLVIAMYDIVLREAY